MSISQILPNKGTIVLGIKTAIMLVHPQCATTNFNQLYLYEHVIYTWAGRRSMSARHKLCAIFDRKQNLLPKWMEGHLKALLKAMFDIICGVRPYFCPPNQTYMVVPENPFMAGDWWRGVYRRCGTCSKVCYNIWQPSGSDSYITYIKHVISQKNMGNSNVKTTQCCKCLYLTFHFPCYSFLIWPALFG